MRRSKYRGLQTFLMKSIWKFEAFPFQCFQSDHVTQWTHTYWKVTPWFLLSSNEWQPRQSLLGPCVHGKSETVRQKVAQIQQMIQFKLIWASSFWSPCYFLLNMKILHLLFPEWLDMIITKMINTACEMNNPK